MATRMRMSCWRLLPSPFSTFPFHFKSFSCINENHDPLSKRVPVPFPPKRLSDLQMQSEPRLYAIFVTVSGLASISAEPPSPATASATKSPVCSLFSHLLPS